ncbi:hypothetical protein CH76_03990 [Lysinibacillus sp. BF-4]|uniref:universal stress protein n=1 Tax=Lysinibacillus sp. BF-4 TaxID=1473546 RepID=UPI000502C8CE|nr:universal stress protein [Lysinibacillus sp. BF-4]KFL43847.1 hypothetical protein CH76_03990 [Lysinibacillus sp. BF-4]
MYKQIVVAIDGSENAIRAAKEAAKLAHNQPATINLVYVAETDEEFATKSYSGGSGLQEIERRRKIANVETVLKQQNIHCQIVILQGEPVTEIVAYAKEKEADMIVVGHHGMSGLRALMLGSTSKKIVKQSTIPVLIVK